MRHTFLLIFFLLMAALTTAQPHIMASANNGTYYGTWRYKNSPRLNTTYFRISFLNDSTFAFTIGDETSMTRNKNIDLNYNKSMSFLSFIGRKIRDNGKQRWLAIMDLGGSGTYGFDNFEKKYPDTVERIELKQTLNADIRNLGVKYTENIYTIYEFNFFKDSLKMSLFKENASSRDDGELGMHYKIDGALLNFDLLKNTFSYPYLFANYSADITRNCTGSFLPLQENIKGNKTPYIFRTGEKVLIIGAYIKYSLIAEVSANRVVKFGWIPRSNLGNVTRISNNRFKITSVAAP